MNLREQLKQEYERGGGSPVPKSWKPQAEGPGSIVAGKLIKVHRGVPTEYGAFDVAHVEDEKRGRVTVWLSHAVLQQKWEEADPQPGDQVGILYEGERDGNSRSYHMYRVKVERAEKEQPPQQEPQGQRERQAQPPRNEQPKTYGDGYGAEQDRGALPY